MSVLVLDTVQGHILLFGRADGTPLFALAEAGDVLLAIEEGHFARTDIVGEIGQVIDGKVPGRSSESEITVYKSLGNTAQDLAAAHYVYTQVTGNPAAKDCCGKPGRPI